MKTITSYQVHIVETATYCEGYYSLVLCRGLTFGERGTRSQLFPESLLWSRMGGFPMMKISSLNIDTWAHKKNVLVQDLCLSRYTMQFRIPGTVAYNNRHVMYNALKAQTYETYRVVHSY